MERKFLVLLRRFSLRKEHYYFMTFDCSFLRPHGETRRFLSEFGDSSSFEASMTEMPTHKKEPRHTKFFKEWRGAKSICVCPKPTQRAQTPAVFRRYYKMAGVASLEN